MEEFSPEIVARRDLYLDLNSIEVEGLLGRGLDGVVWRTSRKSALKIHRFGTGYGQERDVYLRLQKHSLDRIERFSIPILLHYDDSCLAWRSELAAEFDRDWPEVQRLLNTLRQYGIYFCDAHSRNISLRP